MHVLYIPESLKGGRHYVGITRDVDARLRRHDAGATVSTKPFRPWKIIYTEVFTTRNAARARELQLKRMKGGAGFRRLLHRG